MQNDGRIQDFKITTSKRCCEAVATFYKHGNVIDS